MEISPFRGTSRDYRGLWLAPIKVTQNEPFSETSIKNEPFSEIPRNLIISKLQRMKIDINIRN